tara:strand:- start:3726 stop:4112 length:387 start_codon:yes stop_codon:yes gene_type:complete
MALPSSGQLGINRIRIELGASATNQSLRAFSNTAGFSSPDKITDFYGFTNLTSFLGSALQGGTKNICSANTNITYYHNGSGTTPVVNDIVYTNSGGTTTLGAGYMIPTTGGYLEITSSGVVNKILPCI